jgi:hypothetical protein
MTIEAAKIAYDAYRNNFVKDKKQHFPYHEQWEECDDPKGCWCGRNETPKEFEKLSKYEQNAWVKVVEEIHHHYFK